MSTAMKSTRPDGISVIAIYYLIMGVLNLIGACAIVVFPLTAIVRFNGGPDQFFPLVGLGFGLLTTLALGVLALVAGWGLMRMVTWSRWLAFALALVSLLFFPVGTLIGAVIIWYLLRGEVREAFELAAVQPAM
jgi:hypothetical protein